MFETMLQKAKIDQFYTDVAGLNIKFPVSSIARATGFSKGNVSEYINRKKEPSESFLNAFYDWFKNVPRETLNGTAKMEELTELKATVDVLFDVAVEVLSAASGKSSTLIRKELEKRVDELKRFSGG